MFLDAPATARSRDVPHHDPRGHPETPCPSNGHNSRGLPFCSSHRLGCYRVPSDILSLPEHLHSSYALPRRKTLFLSTLRPNKLLRAWLPFLVPGSGSRVHPRCPLMTAPQSFHLSLQGSQLHLRIAESVPGFPQIYPLSPSLPCAWRRMLLKFKA